MILSDTDIRREIAAGRIVIEGLVDEAVQPSSVDLHVDNKFRVFANNRYPYIDVKKQMDDLTELVEVPEGEAFILHPGEFVLGSTLESVTLPDDLVARLEGKSSLGRLGLLIHSSLPASEPVMILDERGLAPRPIGEVVRKEVRGSVVAFDPETFEVGYHEITGWYQGPSDRIFEVVLASGRRVRVTAGHNLFTLDRSGALVKARTLELQRGSRVAIPRRIPDPSGPAAPVDLLAMAPESAYPYLACEGPTVAAAFERLGADLRAMLRAVGLRHARYYEGRARLPLGVALQVPGLAASLGPSDRICVRGSGGGLPPVLEVDRELAWLLGFYVAGGHRGRGGVAVSHTDRAFLDRAQATLAAMGLSVHRGSGQVTCRSSLLSEVLRWLGVGRSTVDRRIPPAVFGWPRPLVESFLYGLVDGNGSREAARTSLWTSSPKLAGDFLGLAARLRTLYPARWPRPAGLPKLDRLLDGDLLWDVVSEVRDTGQLEPIYDLEVRPGGAHVENFLAGSGGVFVSNTAGFVDAGWSGHLTLELSNVANLPITIYPGMKIGQIAFFRLSSPAEATYGSEKLRSKYQGQQGPTPSRYWENFRE